MGVLLSIAIYWQVSKVTVVPSWYLLLMRVQDVQQRVHNILESTPGKLEVLTRLMLGWTSPYKPSSNIIRRFIFIASKPSTNKLFFHVFSKNMVQYGTPFHSFLMVFPNIWYSNVQSPFLKYLMFPMENSRWKIAMMARVDSDGFRCILWSHEITGASVLGRWLF